MLASIDIAKKVFGDNLLFSDLKLDIQDGEKIGLIGRNGTGKSTLLRLITGEDKDFDGNVTIKRGAIVCSSRQEHHGFEGKTVLEYIQGNLPEYAHLADIIDKYPATMGDNKRKIQEFSNALERFEQLGYFQLEAELEKAFNDYQIEPDKIHQPINSLSGGQKRMIELIKVQRSRGHIALIDEPTNHMDYIAKESFIDWLKSTKEAVLVITHDRDVLDVVDRIVEIRDKHCYYFKGNYHAYLKNNSFNTINQVNEYEHSQRRISKLQDDVQRFKRLKEKARDPGTIRRFKSQQQKALEQIKELQATTKPSFWIDRESASNLNDKLTNVYEKHKSKNINLGTHKKQDGYNRLLIKVDDISLGYNGKPLFKDISFNLCEGDKIRLHGRNGAGKTTLIKAILAQVANKPLQSECFGGHIDTTNGLNIGYYEQEISQNYLDLSLDQAIENILRQKNQPVSTQRVKQLESDYLFDPETDGNSLVGQLSGGQKARIQLINMLIDNPAVLILDEPTNHLDLPSIEELENSMSTYKGAVIYISHDSFFANKLGGQTVIIDLVSKQ